MVHGLRALLATILLGGALGVGQAAVPGIRAASSCGPIEETAATENLPSLDVGEAGATPESHACSGRIQPGARMTSPSWCTLNFVFRDDLGGTYVGSAGHCVDPVGTRVSADGVGEFGTVAYRVRAGIGDDFALIHVDAEKLDLVDPTLCHWGGPSELTDGETPEKVLMQYGWGTLTSQIQPARARLFEHESMSGSAVRYVGISSGGDSGSPIMDSSGTALAVHTHRSDEPFYVATAGFGWKWGTNVGDAIARAEAVLGRHLDLVPGTVPASFTGYLPPG